MLAHELRNPLAPIKNAVAILERCVDKPAPARCVEILGRQVSHMAKLIDDLVDVNRVTRGKVRLELASVELNELVRAAAESVESIIGAHNHSLQLRLAGRATWVLSDSTRLNQVFVNLLTNAAKYTPAGGQIEVAVDQDEEVARCNSERQRRRHVRRDAAKGVRALCSGAAFRCRGWRRFRNRPCFS